MYRVRTQELVTIGFYRILTYIPGVFYVVVHGFFFFLISIKPIFGEKVKTRVFLFLNTDFFFLV